jgi:hypothetical protein
MYILSSNTVMSHLYEYITYNSSDLHIRYYIIMIHRGPHLPSMHWWSPSNLTNSFTNMAAFVDNPLDFLVCDAASMSGQEVDRIRLYTSMIYQERFNNSIIVPGYK